MKKFDVFISHASTDNEYAKSLVTLFKEIGIECWISYNEISGGEDYSIVIPDAIRNSSIFLLLLTESSINSVNVAKEISIANNALNRGIGEIKEIVPILLEKCDLDKMEYFLTNIQIVNSELLDKTVLLNKIPFLVESKLFKNKHNYENVQNGAIVSSSECLAASTGRVANKYITAEDTKERNRLEKQSTFFRKFDQPIYDKAIKNKKNLVVLDIGCNDGSSIIERIGLKSEVSQIIGIDCVKGIIDEANEKYSDKDFINFYYADIEDKGFKERLDEILKEEQVEEVDLINISMVLLHLKNPMKVLKNLKKVLKKGGTLIVKDVDDGISIAYPDNNGTIDKMIKRTAEISSMGYRFTGRQIYTGLKNLEFKNIRLALTGINTCGLCVDDKETLYEFYFDGCIYDSFKSMADSFPAEKKWQMYLEEYEDAENDIEESFYDDSFFFILGVMIYVCEKA